MKLFISADIEGTAGIVHWDETEYGKNGYDTYRRHMTAEVAAACKAAHTFSNDAQIVIKDAHDSARNILVEDLPEYVQVFRGWADDPMCMMFGLDRSFSGVILTGYHSPAGTNDNPLAHTMTTRAQKVTLNGVLCPEAMISALTASYMGVPTLVLSGDESLCRSMQEICPSLEIAPVSKGVGGGSMAVHPRKAQEMIANAVSAALAKDMHPLFPMPSHFHMEISYIKHQQARHASFYPGAKTVDAKTIAFDSDDWMEMLRFIHFTL